MNNQASINHEINRTKKIKENLEADIYMLNKQLDYINHRIAMLECELSIDAPALLNSLNNIGLALDDSEEGAGLAKKKLTDFLRRFAERYNKQVSDY